MKTISKRILAVLIAVIMAMPTVFAVPFSASAETVSEAAPINSGLVRTGSYDRGSGNNGCITNDGGDDNMSAILWEFDLSAIKGGSVVTSATFLEDIWSINNTNIPNQYLDFWYCNPADMSDYSNYLNNNNFRDSSLGYGTEGPSTYKAAFGITESAPLYSVQHVFDSDSATLSFSNDELVDVLNKAVDERWGSIVFVAMFNEPAENQWSDIWAGFPKLSYETAELDDETYVKEKMASYNGKNLEATSGRIQFSSGGKAYTDNVLYSANGNFDSNYFEGVLDGNNKLGFNIYPASSRVVYLYSSEDCAIGYPLIAKIQKSSATATTVHYGVNYLATDNAANWSLTDDWYVCSGDRTWDNLFSSQTDKAYGVNRINYDPEQKNHYNENIVVGSYYSHSEGHFTDKSPITVANAIYYDNSSIDFGENYYYSIPAVPTFRGHVDACGHWIGGQTAWNSLSNWNSITINGKTDIDLRVLNIKPLYDIVSSADFKDNFNNITSNEADYSKSSLRKYYETVARILEFNPKELDVSDDSALAASSNEIKSLVDDYNAYKTPDSHADFTELRRAYSKGNDILLGLDEKVARYDTTSVQALIDALGNSQVVEYLSAEDISEYGTSDEAVANALAQDIYFACASLNEIIGDADMSAYSAAAETINSLDKDVYSDTKSIGSATRIANILIGTTAINYADALNGENTSTISCFNGAPTQQNVDYATRTIIDALYVSVKYYNIVTNDSTIDISFQNGTSTGEESPYSATYGSNVIAHSNNNETAWYMDFSSESTSRSKQYQGYGESFATKVVADINIYAEKRTEATPNRVRIIRNYSNDSEKTPVQLISFVENSYTLPEAPAYSSYSFSGYEVGGEIKSANDVIEINGDTDIKAIYTYNGSAEYAVNASALENGKGFNDSVAYNTKIELEGGDNSYAWIEEVSTGKFRPFAIGSDITFFATESITLIAVTEEEFNSYNFSLPVINMRKDGYITNGTKVVFNAQVVEMGSAVREYGIIIGVSKNGEPINSNDITAENAGSYEDYDIIRAKSTKSVGANQFSIGINGLAGKDFVYRGYVIYEKTNREYVTVYTDVMQ